jgi:2'-5' RNA ligase
MRTFIAVELPDEVKKNIIELVNELKEVGSAVKWVDEKNLHITLKFLGWVEDRKVDNVVELATKVAGGTGSFKAKFEGMGTFPSGKSPRVVWVGIGEGGEKLKKLANSLEETLASAGYRSEEREFSSHVTIGRIKESKGVDKLKEKMESIKDPKFGEALVDHIDIMKSTLTPKGPVYETVMSVMLK